MCVYKYMYLFIYITYVEYRGNQMPEFCPCGGHDHDRKNISLWYKAS